MADILRLRQSVSDKRGARRDALPYGDKDMHAGLHMPVADLNGRTQHKGGTEMGGKEMGGKEVAPSDGGNKTPKPDNSADVDFDQKTRHHIGRVLKESYEDLLKQPVPDRFVKILEELERQEKQK